MNVREIREILANNLAQVEERLQVACTQSGRARAEVTLVAITKYVPPEVAGFLCELGVLDLGESRPQELWRKAEYLPKARWHLVGHLQRNKIERSLSLLHCLHSVDSLRLLKAVHEEAQQQQRTIPVMLEFNCSGEASKHGFAPSTCEELVQPLQELTQVRVLGLMTMAAADRDARPTFAQLRGLRDWLRERVGSCQPLTDLSMGMSGDFELAIAEGATHVRLGSILFEGLTQHNP